MKDKIFGVLQRVGRSFMLPIAILPVAGLLLGIGGSFTNATMIQAYHLETLLGEGTLLNGFLNILNSCGNVVFENLPLLFAIGVAIGMAKQEKEVAALASVIAFFIMHTAIHALLILSGSLVSAPVFDSTGAALAGMVGSAEQTVGMLDGSVTKVLGISSLQMGVLAVLSWDLELPPCIISIIIFSFLRCYLSLEEPGLCQLSPVLSIFLSVF